MLPSFSFTEHEATPESSRPVKIDAKLAAGTTDRNKQREHFKDVK